MIRRGLILAVLALPIFLIGDVAAQAAYDPVARGTTTITFDREFTSRLAKHRVKIAVREGRGHGGVVKLDASGGSFDPRLGAGTVESRGTIVLTSGRRKVILREIAFKTKRAPLYAKVGGGQLKLAAGARLSAARAGFGVRFAATHLRLTSKLATRLNKKLRLGRELSAGQAFANVRVSAEPSTVHLEPRGRLYLSLDPAFTAKLDRLFVSVNPIAPAELTAGTTLTFPVAPESTLAPDGASGTVKLEGQAELLQLGHAQMFWREVWWEPAARALLAEKDIQPAPPQAGVSPQSPLLSMDAAVAAASNPGTLTIDVQASPVRLTDSTAAALNAAFVEAGSSAFSPGELAGQLSLEASAE